MSQKKEKKSSRRKKYNVTSLKYITIFKKKKFNRIKKFKYIKICNRKNECQFKLTPAEYGLKELIFTLRFFSLRIACLARFSLIHKKDL